MSIHITSGISRLVFGKLADHPNISRIRLQQIAFFGFGTVTMLIPFLPSFYWLIGACLCMGIFDGIFICLLGPIAFDIVGPSKASQAIGFLLGIFSIPLMCGPPVAGKYTFNSISVLNFSFYNIMFLMCNNKMSTDLGCHQQNNLVSSCVDECKNFSFI